MTINSCMITHRFPRHSITFSLGYSKRTSDLRRSELVPTTEPAGMPASDLEEAPFRMRSTSRGSPRSRIAPIIVPGANLMGRSSRQCTKTSTRPASRSASSSEVPKSVAGEGVLVGLSPLRSDGVILSASPFTRTSCTSICKEGAMVCKISCTHEQCA